MTKYITEDKVKGIFSEHLGNQGFSLKVDELEYEDDKVTIYKLLHPWNDNTLFLAVPPSEPEASALADTLSKVDLPEKYSAIFHKDTSQLEVLWTAFKVREKHEEVANREFLIWWRNKQRKCWFGNTSDRALEIAKCTLPFAAASHTEHRNIMSFHHFMHSNDRASQGMADHPVSFWIDCSELSYDEIELYLRTINYYMTYYDRETPTVLIHEPSFSEGNSERPRYVEGNFPTEIVAGEVDPSVASFWLGVFKTQDPAMKYLLHYRMIEYIALSHLKDTQQKELIEILRRPHLLSAKESAAAEITRLLSTLPRETDRIKHFVDDAISKEKVWLVLEMNRELFSKDTEFDGGFTVRSTLNGGATCETWAGPRSLVDKLRSIRNCLAHGQDDGTRGVIHATGRNRSLLAPWVNLIETFSAEAMLYSRRETR